MPPQSVPMQLYETWTFILHTARSINIVITLTNTAYVGILLGMYTLRVCYDTSKFKMFLNISRD